MGPILGRGLILTLNLTLSLVLSLGLLGGLLLLGLGLALRLGRGWCWRGRRRRGWRRRRRGCRSRACLLARLGRLGGLGGCLGRGLRSLRLSGARPLVRLRGGLARLGRLGRLSLSRRLGGLRLRLRGLGSLRRSRAAAVRLSGLGRLRRLRGLGRLSGLGLPVRVGGGRGLGRLGRGRLGLGGWLLTRHLLPGVENLAVGVESLLQGQHLLRVVEEAAGNVDGGGGGRGPKGANKADRVKVRLFVAPRCILTVPGTVNSFGHASTPGRFFQYSRSGVPWDPQSLLPAATPGPTMKSEYAFHPGSRQS